MKTKKYYAFDDKPPITYRPGTSDESIINAVIERQSEYLFPNFRPKVVFDIGANIGVVSIVLANIYPDAKIYSFEPVKENYDLLVENCSHYKNIVTNQCGLGNKTETRKIHKSTDLTNLGGFSTFIKDGKPAEDIQVTRSSTICSKFGAPDLIKIDVEGAEYEIIQDMSAYLPEVTWIAGELHGVNDFKLLDLLSPNFKLGFGKGFESIVWHFHAVNKKYRPES